MYRVHCHFFTLAPCAMLARVFSNLGVAAEWGSVTRRFVIDGEPPQLKAFNITKDQYCIDNPPDDESVIVGDKGGLVNVAVYVRANLGEKLDVHPD